MRGVFSEISFDSLAQNLRDVIAWIEKMGISTPPTRVAKYRKLLDAVIEIAEHRDLVRANAGYASYVCALYEAHELVQCWQGISNLLPRNFKERFYKIVSGPDWYSDELQRASSNLARNTAFELLVTTLFARAGLSIEDDQLTDVSICSASHAFLIECKRPQSVDALPRVIKNAKRQLRLRLEDPRRIGARGVVALDLTKMANPRFELLVAPSPLAARSYVERYVSDFVDRHNHELNLARERRIIAFLVRLSVIAECEDTNSIMYCQQWGIAKLPDLSLLGEQAFLEIVAALDPSDSRPAF